MTRFKSVTTRPIVAAISSVRQPTIAPTSAAAGACSNSGYMRAIRYTPAVTIVAAWISADTGVGPSIASGSQVWSGSWADFADAPTRISRQMTLITNAFIPAVVAVLRRYQKLISA